jgi:hypothetical protein
MRRWQRASLIAVGAVVGLIVLYFLFEWAGDILDSGGVVGA